MNGISKSSLEKYNPDVPVPDEKHQQKKLNIFTVEHNMFRDTGKQFRTSKINFPSEILEI